MTRSLVILKWKFLRWRNSDNEMPPVEETEVLDEEMYNKCFANDALRLAYSKFHVKNQECIEDFSVL